MSVLNRPVSYFPGITATTQGVEVNLLSLLENDKHKDEITRLRLANESDQKTIKLKLPCYTVAGTFNRRCDEGLTQSSGLAAVDLDSAEDYDAIYLLGALKKIDCIAYAGLSCRGQRLFCIVSLKHPDMYVKHYERLIQSFVDMGLPMGDDCHKRISQPRFVTWNDDSTQFFNHNAKTYDLLPPEKKYFPVRPTPRRTEVNVAPNDPFAWCVEQINKSHSFTEGVRHDYTIHLARYCNMKGLSESETLQGCLGFVQEDFPEAEIRSIVDHVYAKHIDSHNKLPFTQLSSKKKQHNVSNNDSKEKSTEKYIQEMIDIGDMVPIAENYFTGYHNCKPEFEAWGQRITDVEQYFKTAVLPEDPIKIKQGSTIVDVHKFIRSHLEVIKTNDGNPTYLSYLERLEELKEYLNAKVNLG